MKIDITLKITPEMVEEANINPDKSLAGHLGTHFDVMNKEFPIDYTERKAVIFDVSRVGQRDIEVSDISVDKIKPDMFVAFYTGFIEKENYGTRTYFKEHPQLSKELIQLLLEKGISIIGIDFAGVRRGKEHIPTDQLCADNGIFVLENLCNLKNLINTSSEITIHTYPINYVGTTGLPCRVIAETTN